MENEFKDRLQMALSKKGITAAELSRLSGVGKTDISNYIRGVYNAKADKAYMLAKALDVDPGWLLTGDEPAVNRFPSFVELPPPSLDSGNAGVMELLVAWGKAKDWQKAAVRKLLNMKEMEE